MDENGYPQWVNGENAIWWSNDFWHVGLLENVGTEEAELTSLTQTVCPHSFVSDTGVYFDDIDWKYKNTEKEWTNALVKPNLGVLVVPGKKTIVTLKNLIPFIFKLILFQTGVIQAALKLGKKLFFKWKLLYLLTIMKSMLRPL